MNLKKLRFFLREKNGLKSSSSKSKSKIQGEQLMLQNKSLSILSYPAF